MFRCFMAAALVLFGGWSGSSSLADGASQDEDWKKLTARIEHAVLNDDAATLKLCRAEALRMQTAPGGHSRALVAYAVAYVGWRLAFSPSVPQAEQDALLDEAENQLKAALKIDPKSAEAFALLSGVYGAKIAHSPMRGILLGPRSNGAIENAVTLAPDNPRVLLSKGIGKFNTPAMFGGSDTEAESLIRRALGAFDTEPIDKAWPNWGRFDAHAWLGQILANRGDKGGARAEYEKALAIAPKSGWVRYVLLPALQK
jgi:tetratricopeptide (TPR) repeat protein